MKKQKLIAGQRYWLSNEHDLSGVFTGEHTATHSGNYFKDLIGYPGQYIMIRKGQLGFDRSDTDFDICEETEDQLA